MFSRIRGNKRKSAAKEKSECRCVNVPVNEKQDEDNEKIIDIECSSHPGFCVLDENGLCTKRENAPHCSLSPIELIGETYTADEDNLKISDCDKTCGKKFRTYKIDLNNAEDTGLFADKQCQTCGPLCSPATCSSRTREFFISWDKRRSQILLTLIFVFVLWICIYVSVTAATSSR